MSALCVKKDIIVHMIEMKIKSNVKKGTSVLTIRLSVLMSVSQIVTKMN